MSNMIIKSKSMVFITVFTVMFYMLHFFVTENRKKLYVWLYKYIRDNWLEQEWKFKNI